MPIMVTLRAVKTILRGEEKYTPLFMKSQRIEGKPKENQLAKRAVWDQLVWWIGGLDGSRVTYDQTQEVAEDGNRGCDDPGENPHAEGNSDPGADGDPVALVHAVCAAEDADVDVLDGDVAVDDTGDHNLGNVRFGFSMWIEVEHTVGRAIP